MDKLDIRSVISTDKLTASGKTAVDEIQSDLDELDLAASELLKSKLAPDRLRFFTELVTSINSRIKQSPLDENEKRQLRSALCGKARETAVSSQAGANPLSVSKCLTCFLADQFGDMGEWAEKLKEDADSLDSKDRKLARISTDNYRQFLGKYTGQKASQGMDPKKAARRKWILVLCAVVLAAVILIPKLFPGKAPEPNETVYSSKSESGDRVYADIVRVTPQYTITSKGSTGVGGRQFSSSSFLCQCVTKDGESVWVYFLASQYRSRIDPSVSDSSGVVFFADTKEFNPAVRVHGGLVSGYALTLNVDGGNQISSAIGDRLVIYVSSIDDPLP